MATEIELEENEGSPSLEALAGAAERVAGTPDLQAALGAVATGTAAALAAELVVVRLVGEDGDLVARAVAPEGSPLAAEVAGTRAECGRLADGVPSDPVVRVAGRVYGAAAIAVPARAGTRLVGAVEVVRRKAFGEADRAVATLAAAQVALAVRALAHELHAGPTHGGWLEAAGEALAAGSDPRRTAQQALQLAAGATRARGGVVWRVEADGPTAFATLGAVNALLPRATVLAAASLDRATATVEWDDGLPFAYSQVVTLRLERPPFALLQLFYPQDGAPSEDELASLAAFAPRVGLALQSGERTRSVEQELERTQALLEVVGEAISRLSLAHTLETAVERISELLQVDRVAVYLHEAGRLFAAAGRGVGGRDAEVAERVSEAFAGPLRARGSLHAAVGGREAALAPVRRALRTLGQPSVVAVPLHVRDESIGLLVVYPDDRDFSEADQTLLAALAAQLAVAVQNARLHERATELGTALFEVLDAERRASRQVNALYEISRSFAQTLSLDSTLAAVTETLVAELGVDAAVVRVPDERGDQLVPRAVHVADSRLAEAVRTILERPQVRPLRSQQPVLLDLAAVARIGGAHELLRPFLEAGSTAALLPIATPSELLAELTIVSLDPAEPITAETLATARTIAQQAALAIDNARLYQQQTQFAETMQQSLLPRERPTVAGLQIGHVYESAAKVAVGGDVYDFLELGDGALAVVLGDVTGHGIDATADMAMAKFVFRSLAREHSAPSDFLAHANGVVVDEIGVGKFITMAYLTIDPSGALDCASAGHPEPRVVHPDGSVRPLACGGLALGIVAPQEYEQVSDELPRGGAVVLYTDGVVESRRGRELFGVERLDEILTANAAQPAQAIADAVLAACRGFAGGDLPDDCAIVVIRRT